MGNSFETYKPRLFAVAYKMTKNAMDAEDILHDVFLSFVKQDITTIANTEHYLVKAVMHRCLSLLEMRKRFVYPGVDLPTPLYQERFAYVQDQDISFALLLLLQKLNPQERAVFILRETLDYSYEEIAEVLSLGQDNCRQLFHRAKEKVAGGRVKYVPSDEQRSTLFSAFVKACTSGDVDQLMACLKEDIAIYSDGGGRATAARWPVFGRVDAIAFLTGLYAKRSAALLFEAKMINGEYGIICYDKTTGAVDTLMICAVGADAIETVYFVRNPDKLR